MDELEDEWVPRISCQACGESWSLETVIQHNCRKPLAHGSQPSLGIAGALGPSTLVSELLDLAQRGVSTTPDDGLNTFPGRLLTISSPWSAEREGEFILTVFFDSLTLRRLVESLYGDPGRSGMEDAEFSLTMKRGERPTT